MRTTEWKLAPWTVLGGFRIARVRWEASDQVEDFSGLDPTVYPTEEACEAAIEALAGRRE